MSYWKKGKTMASKRFSFGMLVIALVFGITVAGCDNDTTNGNGGGDDESAKSIKIEGISLTGQDLTDRAGIGIFSEIPPPDTMPTFAAIGYGSIASNTLTVELTVPGISGNTFEDPSNPWKGKGGYFVLILPLAPNRSINGYELRAYVGDTSGPVKVTIANPVTTLAFSKFKKTDEL